MKMKNVMMMLMLVAATFAALASHNHDGKKGKKHAKAHKECTKGAQSADGTVPACCKAKANGAKAADGAPAKSCAGAAEGKACCKSGAGAQHHGEHEHKTN